MLRLLFPSEFGLAATVTAAAGICDFFERSLFSRRSAECTEEQKFTPFLCLLTAPVVVHFYEEPPLFWVTVALFTGPSLERRRSSDASILRRELRCVALPVIDILGVLAARIRTLANIMRPQHTWTPAHSD